MDELVKMVAQRTGLGEDKALTAVQTVIGFLKERLPAPVAAQLDGLVAGGAGGAGGAAGAGGVTGGAGDMLKGLGGMMGKQ
jgi:hypothetical protein